MQNFKPGDTVQLKSGGPYMTVVSYDDEGHVICTWWNNHVSEMNSAEFKTDAVLIAVNA
jgi:uncharacterized protein YodC (DUF2158 family)